MLCRWRPLLSSFSTRLTRRTLSTPAPEPAAAPPQVILRPYQELCLASCTQALASGSTRIGVSLPTGSGKTTVFISLLARIPPPATNKDATRALIVVNSIELARQAAAQVGRMFPEWVVELEQGAKNHATGLADV
jgi:ATP-dependent helicase IRC3